jgi:Fe-S-cluster containining protein
MRYYWLNFHVGYACRNSGACCSAGWEIPIERGVAGTLPIADNGHCVFHVNNACAIHATKPPSCVHFPYVCLIDQRGVQVTLSHFCPTAASLLFEHEGPIEIVEGPPPIRGIEIPEGLDATEALPPRASATRLMSFQEFSDWEKAQIGSLPERVAAGWPAWGDVVSRFLAAKLFASWAAYQGDGTGAVLQSVDLAESVLKTEVARQCAAAGRQLDAGLLKEAIRQSDLFLVHRADSRLLSAPE